MDADALAVERRSQPRASSHHIRPLAIRVRPGHEARVKDVSASGARIETGCRLLPNSSIDLRLSAGHRQVVTRAMVIRCTVCRLDAGGPVYESALRFSELLTALDDVGSQLHESSAET